MAEPAEPNVNNDPQNDGSGENKGGNGQQGSQHKNVSFEDFQKLANQVDGFTSKLDKFLDVQNNGNSKNDDGKDGDNGKPTQHNDEFNDRLTKTEKELAEYKAKEARQNLISFAKSEAKNSNVNIDNIVETLIGKDEESTKANVKKFVETVKANTKSTDTGFPASAKQYKNSDDFMNMVYKSKGIAQK